MAGSVIVKFTRDLGVGPDKVNLNGGAAALRGGGGQGDALTLRAPAAA